MVTTKLSFSEWASVFGDTRMITARLDRLTHHDHIVETGNQSWRFRHSKAQPATTKSNASKTPLVEHGSLNPSWRQTLLIGKHVSTCFKNPMICGSVNRPFLMPFLLQVEGPHFDSSGTAMRGQVNLACALLRACAPRPGLYVTVGDLMRLLRETWRRNTEQTERSLLSSLADADLLVLDEIGVQHGTDAERLHLFDAMDARYRANRPTVLITNEPVAELRDCLGNRVTDRLRETSRVLTLTWESARSAKRSSGPTA